MLKLDNIRTVEGLTVHGDDQSDHTFYVLPERPTISRLPTGGLALRFVEYGQLREVGEKKFGGFVAFDADLSIPKATINTITQKLQAEVDALYQGRQAPIAAVAPISWLGGTVSLVLQQGALIEKINAAARPSLVGTNIACFSLELSELGTAVFKETLSTGSGSMIQVHYHLTFYARLPEMSAWGTWNASEFYSFFQDINTEDNFWSEDSYTEIQSSSRYKNDVTKTHFEFTGNPNFTAEEQSKFEDTVRAAINGQLAEAVKRNMLTAIADVDPNVKDLQEGQDIEDIRRTVNKVQIASVRVEWSEAKAIVTDKDPQGMLPTVTSMSDADGNKLKWEDYYSKINVDEFLKTVQVTVQVNADFAELPIHSVEVKLRYPHGPNAKTQEFTFSKPDDVKKFETFVHEGIRKVFYSYKVNFKNSTFTFQSPEVETDDTNLIIDVDDLGVLSLDITDGDINFEQVQRAQIVVKYDGQVKVENRYNMTKDEKEFKVREIIKEPRSKPITYQISYEMAGGAKIDTPEKSQDAKVLFVNDPFAAQRTVSVRAAGNMETDISIITVDLLYADDANHYTQRRTINLSKDGTTTEDWSFPAIDDRAGKLTYQGLISRTDGTSTVIPETEAKSSIITVGDVVEHFLELKVAPDLIDWSKVKLVNVALNYVDEPNKVDERFEAKFKSTDTAEKTWKVAQKDKSVTGYTSTISYFLIDGTRKVVGPTPETGLTVFPELPI
jgi:hypothetical protein